MEEQARLESYTSIEQKVNMQVCLPIAFLLAEGELVGAIDDRLIEAAAREMLRERIKATPWSRMGMSSKGRQRAIEREVDAYWHLFIPDAEKHLHASTEDGERQPS